LTCSDGIICISASLEWHRLKDDGQAHSRWQKNNLTMENVRI